MLFSRTGFLFPFTCSFFNIAGPRKINAKNIPDKETRILFHVPGMPRKGSTAIQIPNEMKKLFLRMMVLYLILLLLQIIYSYQKSGTYKYGRIGTDKNADEQGESKISDCFWTDNIKD